MIYPEKRAVLKNQLQKNAIYFSKSQTNLDKIYRNNFARVSSITRQENFHELMQTFLYCTCPTDLKNKDHETLKKFHSEAHSLIRLVQPIDNPITNQKFKDNNLNAYYLNRNIKQENRIRRNLIRQLKLFIKDLNRTMAPHYFAPNNENKRTFVRLKKN